MQIVYIYDLKAKNKKKFNRLKRLFYYHINNLNLKKEFWLTKSTLVVETNQEKSIDLFFQRFKKDVLVYKIYSESIEQLI